MKNILLILLTIFCIGQKTFAYDCAVGGIAYNLNYNTASVTYFSMEYNHGYYFREVKIPSHITYDGTTYTVNTIAENAFINCTKLTSITIPNTVTYIHGEAFRDCSSLSVLTIEDGKQPLFLDAKTTGLKYYREGVFADCRINKLYLGRDLRYSEGGEWPSTQYYPPFYNNVPKDNKNTLNNVTIGKDVTTIPSQLFYSFEKLYSVTLPDSLQSIKRSAFSGTGISEIEIPQSVKSIGAFAFLNCKKLCNVTLPDSIFSIEEGTFKGCEQLATINLPHCLKTLGSSAFSGCKNLKTEIPAGIDSISPEALDNCSSLTKLWIPNVRNADFGLTGCISLDSINIRSAKTIPNGLFSNLPALKYLEIPFTQNNLGMFFGSSCDNTKGEYLPITQYSENGKSHTYYIPKALEEIVIADGSETLAYGAFYNCSMLRKVTLPSTLNGIKEKAFYGCEGLTDIYVKRALPPVAYSGTFEGVNLFACTLHVPYGSKQYYEKATGWKDFYFIEEEAPIKIDVTKNIMNAGEILGLTEYQYGDNVELEAIAHSGYTFSAWTENGNILTTDRLCSFVAESNRKLIAVFVPTLDSNLVQASPKSTKVSFTWEKEADAASYKLTVYEDAAMTIVVGSQSFDTNGNILSRSTSDSISTVFTNLSEQHDYYYSLKTYSKNGEVLSHYIGLFSTSSETSIKKMETNEHNLEITGYYDLNGRKLAAPKKGIHIIRYSDGTTQKRIVD